MNKTKREYEELAMYLSLHNADDEAPNQISDRQKVWAYEQIIAARDKEIAELKAALAWYANEDSYLRFEVDNRSDVDIDKGARARQALKGGD